MFGSSWLVTSLGSRNWTWPVALLIICWPGLAAFSSEQLIQREIHDPMETVILHEIPPDSDQVKTLYEVFSWGREAMGEYLFFGEIDRKAIKPDGTGDLTLADYSASVEVSFEEDFLAYTKSEIEDLAPSLPDIPRPIALVILTPMKISTSPMWRGQWVVERSKQHCIFLYSDVPRSGSVLLRYYFVLDNRVTEISLSAHGHGITLSEMWLRFSKLLTRYEAIPMRRFTGAIRE